MTLDALRGELDRASACRGANIWTMPIINRIDMLTTGIRSEVGAKIFGAICASSSELAATPRRRSDRAGRAERLPEKTTSGQYLNITSIAGGRALRHRRRRRAGRDRDRHRRDDAEQHDRGTPAVPDPRALRAGVQEGRAVARRGPGRRAGGAQIPLRRWRASNRSAVRR
jgi:hypothetical protein